MTTPDDAPLEPVAPAPCPSLAARPAIFLLRLYKRWISPHLGTHCRFHPSCSVYGMGALEKHGLVRGGLLTIWRVLRCNPFCEGGYDPP